MKKRLLWPALFALSVVALAFPSWAQAHFIFLVITGGDAPQARAYFSESAEPDGAPLIKKITQTKGWARGVKGEPQPLVWQETVVGEQGWLAAKLPAAGAVEAKCRYGVISRGGAAFLLNYYAKTLQPANAEELSALGRAKDLELDIVPTVSDGTLKCTVLWKGQPVAGGELVAIDAEGKNHQLKTGEAGEASLPAAAKGLYTLRAKHVEAGVGGEENGQKFTETRHYSTLTIRLPLGTPAEAPKAAP
jgi:hypothetical protein